MKEQREVQATVVEAARSSVKIEEDVHFSRSPGGSRGRSSSAASRTGFAYQRKAHPSGSASWNSKWFVEQFCIERDAEFAAVTISNTVIVTLYRSTQGGMNEFVDCLGSTIKEELSNHYGLHIIEEGNEKLAGNEKIYNNGRHITETGAAEFRHYVNKIDMSDFYLSEDPNFLSRFLCENITCATELAFPLKHSKQGTERTPKWFNRDLKIMREELKQKKTQYRITGNSDLKLSYHKSLELYREMVKEAKRGMYDKVFSTVIIEQKLLGMCEYSASVIDDNLKNIPLTDSTGDELLNIDVKDSAFSTPTNNEEVIKSLKNSSSIDPYDISAQTIKLIEETLSKPLTHLINK
ncbi:hypothetical protein JTB14_022773 [Gonioctena quinquepunctata]|nr:hypothetical protein JTB14_022773 [Gonioctena quinquepunctata]